MCDIIYVDDECVSGFWMLDDDDVVVVDDGDDDDDG